jgi:hypothetical protein
MPPHSPVQAIDAPVLDGSMAPVKVWEETDDDELIFYHIRVIVRQGSGYLFEADCLEGNASGHLAYLPSKLRTGGSVNETCLPGGHYSNDENVTVKCGFL